MLNDFDRFPCEVFHPTEPVPSEEVIKMIQSRRTAYGTIYGTRSDINYFDTYDDPVPKERETVKPSKKIPYYHHRRRF